VTSFEIAAAAMRDKGLDPENDKPRKTTEHCLSPGSRRRRRMIKKSPV
jgi:hypothetical protein